MKFSGYSDFKDFCKKNNFTPEVGLTYLENELKNIGEKEIYEGNKTKIESSQQHR